MPFLRSHLMQDQAVIAEIRGVIVEAEKIGREHTERLAKLSSGQEIAFQSEQVQEQEQEQEQQQQQQQEEEEEESDESSEIDEFIKKKYLRSDEEPVRWKVSSLKGRPEIKDVFYEASNFAIYSG